MKQSIAVVIVLAASAVYGLGPQSNRSEPISDLDYCSLIRQAASYDKKRVRVRAVYAVGFEHSFIYKSECRGRGAAENRVWVEFDDTFEKGSKADIIKRFDELLKPSPK